MSELNTVSDVIAGNRFYTNCIDTILFNGAPKKKLMDKTVKKELTGCTRYGSLNTCQVILNRYAKGDYRDIDELVGDLQLILVDNYKKLKLNHNLKTADYGVEDLLKQCKEIAERR